MLHTDLVMIGVILIGVASGISFGLVNTFFGLRTESSIMAARLSGMAQALGYLIACIGPLCFGLLHDLTHSWLASFILLLITAIVMMTFCAGAGRHTTIENST
ncbi:hypothetical protein [Staphylococcus massiliensis]|uniref:hypothetical protein n=2 Tax=Staphylococcus massiliensis TaxID=555791 RepID=UPI0030D01439